MPKNDLCKRLFCTIIRSPMEQTPTHNPINRPSFWSSIWEWIKVIAIALMISLPIRFFIAEPFVVNGASMDPTFSTGQFLIVDRLSYNFQKPARGEVIVFRYPNQPSTYYIKRIIGLPNETISIKDGKIFIDNQSVSVTKDETTLINDQLASTTALDEPYVQNVHRSYDNLVVKLGPSEYFVMGDNRSESSDSRSWGPLEDNYIIGRPFIRLMPITAISLFPGEHKSK